MPKANKSLKELLHEVRRVAKSREVLTEKRIRKIYQSLVTDLNGFLGNSYAKYADSDGRLSATLLQQKGQYAKFLEEIVRNVDGISPEVKREITSLVEETYKSCYTGMVESVKTAAADSPFAKTVEGLSVQPTVLNTALNNNISKLTLPTVLERHRQEVVYDIQQTLNVGLLNGDRYETMAKRITDRIDVSYGKATNIVRTETHRNIEQGLMDGAEQVAPVFNEDPESNLIYAATWCTMLDERVRPSQVSKGKHGLKVRINRKSKANHQKMEGQIIQVGGKFKLEAHVFAKCPGMSGTARNDCNCRCFLEYELLTKEEFFERGGKLLKKPFTNSNNSVNIKKVKADKASTPIEEPIETTTPKNATAKTPANKTVGRPKPKNNITEQEALSSYSRIITREPQITETVTSVADSIGVEVQGLEYRLKSEESFLRKVMTKPGLTDVESEIKDVIRYTYVADADSLVEKTLQAIEELESRGYKTVQVKNYWLNDSNPYNGINTILVSPDGQYFELQYHTPESFELKNGKLHELYEKQRVLPDAESEEYIALNDEMFKLSKSLKRPKDIEKVK